MKLSVYFDGQNEPGVVVKGKFLGMMDDARFGIVMRHPNLITKIINEAPNDGVNSRNAMVLNDVSGQRIALLCQQGEHDGNVIITDKLDYVVRVASTLDSVDVTCEKSYMVVDL